MTTKPKTRKAQVPLEDQFEFQFRILGFLEEIIADSERKLPCRACISCQYLTCRKAGAFSMREELVGKMYGLGDTA